MDAEITPEPSADERRALLAALAELDGRPDAPPAYESAWRLAGLAGEADENLQATARRLNSAGASRA